MRTFFGEIRRKESYIREIKISWKRMIFFLCAFRHILHESRQIKMICRVQRKISAANKKTTFLLPKQKVIPNDIHQTNFVFRQIRCRNNEKESTQGNSKFHLTFLLLGSVGPVTRQADDSDILLVP